MSVANIVTVALREKSINFPTFKFDDFVVCVIIAVIKMIYNPIFVVMVWAFLLTLVQKHLQAL